MVRLLHMCCDVHAMGLQTLLGSLSAHACGQLRAGHVAAAAPVWSLSQLHRWRAGYLELHMHIEAMLMCSRALLQEELHND